MAPGRSLPEHTGRRPFIVEWTIGICAVAFVIVLAIAAYWDASIRILHVFEALPYLAAAVLAFRRSKLGYALGAASSAAWLNVAGRGSTFISNGFQVLAETLHTGRIVRPEVLIAAPAAVAAAGLLCASLAGYLRLPGRRWSDIAVFAFAICAVTGFFYLIMLAFSPSFLTPLRRAFTI